VGTTSPAWPSNQGPILFHRDDPPSDRYFRAALLLFGLFIAAMASWFMVVPYAGPWRPGVNPVQARAMMAATMPVFLVCGAALVALAWARPLPPPTITGNAIEQRVGIFRQSARTTPFGQMDAISVSRKGARAFVVMPRVGALGGERVRVASFFDPDDRVRPLVLALASQYGVRVLGRRPP
jgi:hypothetical protein